jgi:hypothetical protein
VLSLILKRGHDNRFSIAAVCRNNNTNTLLNKWGCQEDTIALNALNDPEVLQRIYDHVAFENKPLRVAVRQEKESSDLLVFLDIDFPNRRAWYSFVRANKTDPSFRIFRVVGNEIKNLKLDKIEKRLEKFKAKSAPKYKKLMQDLREYKMVLSLIDITLDNKRFELSDFPLDEGAMQQLDIATGSSKSGVSQVVELNYVEKRCEDRFIIELQALLNIDGDKIDCVTDNISIKGVCLKMKERPIGIDTGLAVKVGFPTLHERAKQVIGLMNIPYEVAGYKQDSDGFHVQLKRVHDSNAQKYAEFFKDMIDRNIGKMTLDTTDASNAAKSRLISTVLAESISSVACFIYTSRTNKDPVVKIAVPNKKPALCDYFDVGNGQYNYAVLSDPYYVRLITEAVEKQIYPELVLYVYKKTNADSGALEFHSMCAQDFKAYHEFSHFMESIQEFDYRILKIKAGRVTHVQEQEVNNCIDDLDEKSAHHANKIKTDFERLFLLCDVIDITDDYLDYFQTIRNQRY